VCVGKKIPKFFPLASLAGVPLKQPFSAIFTCKTVESALFEDYFARSAKEFEVLGVFLPKLSKKPSIRQKLPPPDSAKNFDNPGRAPPSPFPRRCSPPPPEFGGAESTEAPCSGLDLCKLGQTTDEL